VSLPLDHPWPSDQGAVIAAVDDQGVDLGSGPWYFAPNGPFEAVIPAGRSFTLYARVYPSVKDYGPDLASCGVRLGGAGNALPNPASSWVSNPIDSKSRRLTFAPDPSPRPLDLRFRDPSCRAPSFCDRINTDLQSLGTLPGMHPRAVAFLAPEEVLIAGFYEPPHPKAGTLEFHRVHHGSDPVLLTSTVTSSFPFEGAYAGTGTIAFVATLAEVYAIDLVSRRATVIETGAWGVGATRDGSVVVYKLLGGAPIAFGPSSTSGVARTDLPSAAYFFSLDGPDGQAALLQDGIAWFESGMWRSETPPSMIIGPASRIALSGSGVFLMGGRPDQTDGRCCGYYRNGRIGDFHAVLDQTHTSITSLRGVEGGFMIGVVRAIVGGVFAFDGSTFCDLSAEKGLGVVNAPFDIACDSSATRGAFVVDASAVDQPSTIGWFSLP
jgi:hypothetical protein